MVLSNKMPRMTKTEHKRINKHARSLWPGKDDPESMPNISAVARGMKGRFVIENNIVQHFLNSFPFVKGQ